MGVQVKVLQKGKVTIPVEVREGLGIREGDYLTLEVEGGRLILLPAKTVSDPTELLCGLAEGVPFMEPVKEELRRAAAARLGRKVSRASK